MRQFLKEILSIDLTFIEIRKLFTLTRSYASNTCKRRANILAVSNKAR